MLMNCTFIFKKFKIVKCAIFLHKLFKLENPLRGELLKLKHTSLILPLSRGKDVTCSMKRSQWYPFLLICRENN